MIPLSWGLVAGAGIALAGTLAVSGVWIKSLQADVQQRDNIITAMRDEVMRQNASIAEWEQTAREAAQDGAEALAAASKAAEAHRTRAAALQARILAAQHTTCGPAIQEIREALR